MINAGAVLYFIAGFVAGAVLWAGLYMVFEKFLDG